MVKINSLNNAHKTRQYKQTWSVVLAERTKDKSESLEGKTMNKKLYSKT